MSNLFSICCMKDLKSTQKMDLQEPEHIKGYTNTPAKCPFLESEMIESNEYRRTNTKPLRLNLPSSLTLKNLETRVENREVLSARMGEVTYSNTKCAERMCLGSTMDIPSRGHVPRTPDETFTEAQAFLDQYYASVRRVGTPAHQNRVREVRQELAETGTYQLKTSELVFGCKLGWRNATRCIGRIQWKKLQIFDCREVTTASGMFEALCNHIKYSTNKGNIRSAITIFPQRTDGKHDYRIWNPQLISYAGYRQKDGTILGDPGRVEFTEVCINLGWKPPYTQWDILPLVLVADGKDPEFFDLPRDIIMEVHMEHPEYKWFKDLKLRWYAVPAVSNMSFDCGGLEFTATAFNGWYMSTEVGCRNLCDPQRLNITKKVATEMGLETNSNTTLWQDRALVEVNVAVLHSFYKSNVSIVDHHSASEQFMKHLDHENKSRGGCPSDWIWIVPPMSASLTTVFHQEMALYYIRPSYDYQALPWKTHQWKKQEGKKPPHRKFHFKQIARAVKFTSKLFARALSKRIKATILYATETGKSEHYAKELGAIFGHVFNAQVHCMADYDMFSIEHETLLLIVTSTFGNGEPPANGADFAEHLFEMLYNEQAYNAEQTKDLSSGSFKLPSPKALLRTNSLMTPTIELKTQLSRLESLKSSVGGTSSVEHIGPLSNVCFAVFALGSSAYPKFCNFGKTVDKILGDLGGERLMDVGTGDEMYGQEQQFKTWARDIFHVACESFCIDDNDMVQVAKDNLDTIPLKEETVRFGRPSEKTVDLKTALEAGFRKHLVTSKVKEVSNLGHCCDERATIFVNIEPQGEVKYEPGDHVGVMACNRKEIVDAVLERLDVEEYDKPLQLQILKETLSVTGAVKTWESHERLPAATVREIFTRFLDITTPPSTNVLKHLANRCSSKEDENSIRELLADTHKYDDWKHHYYPHLAEVLEQFPSCRPQGSLLAALLPPLQPRFYSISSSPLAHKNEIHMTVAVVRYETQGGKGPLHYGVCSNYLQSLKPEDDLYVFTRRAASFHLPRDLSVPIILVGPGTGIAPFRGFWHHRQYQMKMNKEQKAGKMVLFFGCRNKGLDLYKQEKELAVANGVLSKAMIAFSREEGTEKTYVQELLEKDGAEVTEILTKEKGHFYVCGDCKMAEDVQQKLKKILQKHSNMSDDDVASFILTLMDENRYHEDIFGITLRTAEVQSASRESARRIRLESEQSQA